MKNYYIFQNVALFYIAVNLFKAWLIEITGFSYLLLYLVFLDMLLDWGLILNRYAVGQRRTSQTPKKVSGAWGTPQNYYSTDSFYFSFFLKPLTLISGLSFFILLSCHTFLFISPFTVYCSLPCHLFNCPFPF